MGKIPDTAAARKALKVAEIKALLEEAGLATKKKKNSKKASRPK